MFSNHAHTLGWRFNAWPRFQGFHLINWNTICFFYDAHFKANCSNQDMNVDALIYLIQLFGFFKPPSTLKLEVRMQDIGVETLIFPITQ